MKKNICFFAISFLVMQIFATDIRQVMFGNNYETINEVDTNNIFSEHPDIKSYMDTLNISEFDWKDTEVNNGISKRFYRTFEQTIGKQKFIRVVKSASELTDDFILNWRNPYKSAIEGHSYIVQLFYISDDIYAIGNFTVMEANGYTWENGTDLKYEMVEIIHRNENVKGFLFNRLEDRIDHHNRAEENGIYEEVYKNTAEYFLFEDVIKIAIENFGNLKYANDYKDTQYVLIEASQPLIDSKRPFIYTINNAFDGNPCTSYVENTVDNYIGIEFSFSTETTIKDIIIINGYANSEKFYYENNQLKDIEIYNLYDKIDLLENTILEQTLLKQTIKLREEFNTEYIFFCSGTELYKGFKYSDTCLAEFDFHILNDGYIFGE